MGDLLDIPIDGLVAALSEFDGDVYKRAKQQEARLRERLESIVAIDDRLVEDFGAGRISIHNCNRMLAKYRKEQEEVLAKLDALPAKSDDAKEHEARLEQLGRSLNNT